MAPNTSRLRATRPSQTTDKPMGKRISKKVDRFEAAPARTEAQEEYARLRTNRYRKEKRATRAEAKKQAEKNMQAVAPVVVQEPFSEDECDIVGHSYETVPTEFEVLMPTGQRNWIPEIDLTDALIPCLRDYQGRVSGVEWNEDFMPEVAEILSHRKAHLIKDLLFLVKFEAPYDHDIFNREVKESNMEEGDLLVEYKAQHNLA